MNLSRRDGFPNNMVHKDVLCIERVVTEPCYATFIEEQGNNIEIEGRCGGSCGEMIIQRCRPVTGRIMCVNSRF